MTGPITTDVPPLAVRQWAIAGVVALVTCVGAIHRQTARENLELPPDLPVGVVASPRERPLPRSAPPVPPLDSARPEVSATPRRDEIPAPGVTGSLPPDLEAATLETFGDARPGLLACLRAEREARPDASGKLPVTVVVADQGLVSQVALGPSPVRSEPFDECAALTLLDLVFPARIAPREVSLTYDLR
jgi:hypothetical protein